MNARIKTQFGITRVNVDTYFVGESDFNENEITLVDDKNGKLVRFEARLFDRAIEQLESGDDKICLIREQDGPADKFNQEPVNRTPKPECLR